MAVDRKHHDIRSAYHRALSEWYAAPIPHGRRQVQAKLDAARAAFVADCQQFETRDRGDGHIASFRIRQ